MISISNLSKSYGSNKVLENINLNLKEGTIIGIVGENGAGKSTLFRCIAELEPFDGTISYTGGILKNVIGFLETNPYFLTKITGKEYLQLMCYARGIKGIEVEQKNVFQLPLSDFASTYSTGMKKKLAITATLLQQNEIYIYDEPFNGVDIQSNLIIKSLILKLKELGKTVILSSHIFSTLNETCDVIHYLKDKKIDLSVEKDDFRTLEEQMMTNQDENAIQNLVF